MLMEWEKPHSVLLPKHAGRAAGAGRVWCVPGFGACRALVCARVCARSWLAEQHCSQPCLYLPWEPPKVSISHHLSLAS